MPKEGFIIIAILGKTLFVLIPTVFKGISEVERKKRQASNKLSTLIHFFAWLIEVASIWRGGIR